MIYGLTNSDPLRCTEDAQKAPGSARINARVLATKPGILALIREICQVMSIQRVNLAGLQHLTENQQQATRNCAEQKDLTTG